MTTDTNTPAQGAAFAAARLHLHVLWAVHYAHELAEEDEKAARRLLRNDVTRTLRAWNK